LSTNSTVFVVNNSTEDAKIVLVVRAVDKSGSTDGQSQRKFQNERHTTTSRQKR